MKSQVVPGTIDDVLDRLGRYWPDLDRDQVLEAYRFAREAHRGQQRRSGEPYIVHPLAVARILTTIEADPLCVVGALLHDTVEDNESVKSEHLQERFGGAVAAVVDGVTKLKELDRASDREKQATNLRKMLLAMAKDLRVVLIKLGDRLHNMRTLWALLPDRRRRTAEETLQIIAPLAHRLGVWRLKAELEDLSLRYLQPADYWGIVRRLGASRREQEARLETARTLLRQRLLAAGIPAEVQGRVKHVYSIWNKMRREGLSVPEIYDIVGLRVIVHDVDQCYAALGVVHDLWRPIPGAFTDYIAVPKSNRYQSLHTKLLGPDAQPLEVQIRTWDMHRMAEYGIAAHWRYKEGQADPAFDSQIAWLRSLLELGTDLAEQHEYLELLQGELLRDQVFVFTPKGQIVDLPVGATPIDFAYRVHTEVGHHCAGARINGKLRPLSYRLQTGDVVEIITSPQAHPTRDWLDVIQSSRAKAKVRRYLRAQMREENIEQGKTAVHAALGHLPPADRERLDLGKLPEIAEHLGFLDVDSLYAAVGYGDVEPSTVVRHLLEQAPQRATSLAEEVQLKLPTLEEQEQVDSSGARTVTLASGLHGRLARCCNPVPGDPILGYITRGRGIAVHRADCKNIRYRAEKEPERVITVSWPSEPSERPFRAWLEIVAVDRVGLLSHLAAVVSDAGINIASARAGQAEAGIAKLFLQVDVAHRRQLQYLLDRLDRLADVLTTREVPNHLVPKAEPQP
ncbi:MAG: bifunctional (p)ppGpp synthetase/guanosine-3',5'-bis(diphosphate) 3'-pyrophosphohydrolase [Armatimonadetes bacterium]|nr:bifunctional (p)ppGpp synthetase/guanosine-3',5'-bis(diphosphate) 3'-pyrophosphohydrolase [Armatimonadota bacterium]